MPTWVVVVLSVVGGLVTVLVLLVAAAFALVPAGPTNHEVAAGCQRSLDAVSDRARGDVYLTYDPKSVTVTVTSLGDGAWDVYGEVRLSTFGYSRTHTYECRGMTQNQSGTWNIPDRSLS